MQGERLVELGVDAGGFEQRLLGLLAVGFQLGVLDVAARAGAAGLHGGCEIIVRVVGALVAQRQQAEALLGLRDLLVAGEQLLVLGGRLRRRPADRRAPGAISVAETCRSGKSPSAMGRLGSDVVWKFPAAKCCLAAASTSAADLPKALR